MPPLTDRSGTPRSFLAYALTVAAGGTLLFAFSLREYPPILSTQLVVIIIAAAASEFLSAELPMFSVTLAYPLVMTAIVLGGPSAAGLVALFSAVTIQDIRGHKPPIVIAFNAGQFAFSACAGGWVYLLAGGRFLATGVGTFTPLGPADFPKVLIGMTAAALVVPIANVTMTSLGVALYTRRAFRTVIGSAIPLLPSQATLAFVGFLMAQVLSINLLALPLFVFPLLVARQLYQRYTGMRSAFVDTIGSLVGALEAKDPYTRGHSERVSEFAVELGRAVGLDDRMLERLEYAALLHDIGKLAVPGCVLTKPGKLDPAEFARIREHPGRGAEMISRIGPLRDLAPIVAEHHERVDGAGYPNGLAGESISLAARVLAVADSYDAMTTTRAYRGALSRDQAIAELLGGAGTQFDSHVVRSFIESRIGADALTGQAESQPTAVARAAVKEG